MVGCVDVVFGIEVVDSAEICSQPKGALAILDDAPDGRMGQSVAFGVVGRMVLEEAVALVVSVQPVESSYPDVAQVVFTAGSGKIGRDAVGIVGIVTEVDNRTVGLDTIQAVFPAAYP